MDEIVGHCDGVIGEAVSGWIANLTHPQKLAGVLCWGAGQTRLPFLASFARSDVCATLQTQGRFGFAIPLTALQPLGPVIRITTTHGEELPGGAAVALPPPAVATPDRATWVLLHIPKTAGTSLRVALAGHFQPGEVLYLYDDGFTGVSRRELATLPYAQRMAMRFVVGHQPFGVHRHFPKHAAYITIIRDPLDRLRSNYYHHVSNAKVFEQDGQKLALPVAVQNGLVEEFDNLMTRWLSGNTYDLVSIGSVSAADVDQALNNIRTRFRFVGLVEQLDEHYQTLCRIMGLPVTPLTRSNVRVLQSPTAADADIDWAEVNHRNRFDTLLYQRLLEEGLCGVDLASLSHDHS
jgi:hypothetical protein